MSESALVREISLDKEENSLSMLRKRFWEKELQVPLEVLPEYSQELASLPCTAILLDEKSAKDLIASSAKLKTGVIEMQFADSLILTDSHWWLQCFLAEALSYLIVKKAPTLDTHRLVYVTGNNFYSLMAGMTAIKLGFEKLTFVVEEAGLIQGKIDHFHKKFFGVEIRVIKDSELTLQPSNGALLINCLSGAEAESLTEDLTYLNFLEKANSLIVELGFNKEKSEVIKEAEHVSIPHIASSDLWGMRDHLLLKNSVPGYALSPEQYLEKWQSFLASIK